MTENKKVLEYKILGSTVRIASDTAGDTAVEAVNLVREEIKSLRDSNRVLKDIDIAVLVALKMASERINVSSEYKENILSLRAGVSDALNVVNEISPGTGN